jgi:hypothetical protein
MTSPLAEGNRALREGRHAEAIALYTEALAAAPHPTLARLLAANLAWARRKQTQVMQTGLPPGAVGRWGAVIAYDAAWQFPAITEQHAFRQVAALIGHMDGFAYLGFPWATLIDLLFHGQEARAQRLIRILRDCVALRRPGERLITVCQHIFMLNYPHLFAESGIDWVYWSHAVKGQAHFPGHPSLRIRPFPLYPVQAIGAVIDDRRERSCLYSFIGARDVAGYLAPSRSVILDALRDDPRGVVIGRDQWHYHRIVYEGQIHKNAASSPDALYREAADEFKRILRDSVFSLCPSGSGPNSIRLWESIGYGAIPVILSDTYWPPGDPALWEEAAVFCPETPGDIQALPDRLAAMARDEALLARKRRALQRLWARYGPEDFIYDIRRLLAGSGG